MSVYRHDAFGSSGGGTGSIGSDSAYETASWFAPVTNSPPTDANACVHPIASSRFRFSGKSSASHVMAATNSTQTPMKVMHRNSTNEYTSVLNAAATGDREYTRMLATMMVLRPKRSMSQPPSRPNTPPDNADSHKSELIQNRTSGLFGGTPRSSEMAGAAITGSMSNSYVSNRKPMDATISTSQTWYGLRGA